MYSIGRKLTVIHWEMLYTRTCLFWRISTPDTHTSRQREKCKLTTSHRSVKIWGDCLIPAPPRLSPRVRLYAAGGTLRSPGALSPRPPTPPHTLLLGWIADGQDNWHMADFGSGLSAVASCPHQGVVILSLFLKLDRLIFYEGVSGQIMLLLYQFRLLFLYIFNFLNYTLSPLCGGLTILINQIW